MGRPSKDNRTKSGRF